MVAPDWRKVVDAFWIMPHSIRVDDVSTDRGDHLQHTSVNIVGNTRSQVLWRCAQAFWPIATYQFVIAANAPGRDDHCLRTQRKLTHDHTRTRHATLDDAGFQQFPMNAINRAVVHNDFGDTMPEAQCHQSPLHTHTHATSKRL